MALKVYNSLSRRLEEFVPLVEGRVGIYVCGPTVYGHSHVGHAKSYVAFDVIVKWLRHLGYVVRYVQNITDVGHLTDDADEGEDKIGRQSQIDRKHPLELVDEYMRSYFADMQAIGVAHPNMYVRATQHIGEQIEQIQRLLERGHAYEAGGNVYFDVSSWPDYGCLSGRRTDEQIEGTRVEVRSDKRDARDFALWKTAVGTSHILRWQSPWGEGFPGWHIECSAMAVKYLGGTFDIHGGGNENRFPHHECEIAQARAAGDGEFARYWLHNNMINVDGQKMGKSLGNAILIKDVLTEFPAAALRLFLLQTQYSRPSNYTHAAMQAARAGVDRLHQSLHSLDRERARGLASGSDDAALDAASARAADRVTAAMNDDFNTPVAIAEIFELVGAANRATAGEVGAAAAERAAQFLRSVAGDVLGILSGEKADGGADDLLVEPLMDLVIDLRKRLRAEKNWSAADAIRDQLAAMGIVLVDDKDGTRWEKP